MIEHLRGQLAVKKPPYLVIDVKGIGYAVQASMTTIYALPAIGEEVFLYTHYIVREDAHLLYAFVDEIERFLFKEIIKVSGVGPKLALAILSSMNVTSFIECIEMRDSQRLVKIPGVGTKTAERLIVEMKDRLEKLLNLEQGSLIAVALNNTSSNAYQSAQQDAVSALIALGYKPQDAHATIRKMKVENADSETLIRLALQAIVK